MTTLNLDRSHWTCQCSVRRVWWRFIQTTDTSGVLHQLPVCNLFHSHVPVSSMWRLTSVWDQQLHSTLDQQLELPVARSWAMSIPSLASGNRPSMLTSHLPGHFYQVKPGRTLVRTGPSLLTYCPWHQHAGLYTITHASKLSASPDVS